MSQEQEDSLLLRRLFSLAPTRSYSRCVCVCVPQVVQVGGRTDHPAVVRDQPSHPPAGVSGPGTLSPAARLQPRAVAHEPGEPRHHLQPPHALLPGLPPPAVQRGHPLLHARLHLRGAGAWRGGRGRHVIPFILIVPL